MEPNQVGALMGKVRDGIVQGTGKVVYDLAMEEKYQKAAIRALEDGMRHVASQFEAYMAAGAGAVNGGGPGGSGGPGTDAGFWEPPRFEEAVCCMPGMACWTGDFANAAGRTKLLEDIANLEGEMDGAKATFDELNAENERDAADARALALADARDAANKLVNRIADAQVRETKAQFALDQAESTNDMGAIIRARTGIDEAKAKTIELMKEKKNEDEAFAYLEQEDAEGRVAFLESDLNARNEAIVALQAETDYERRLLDQYSLEMADMNKSAEDRAFA
jgi:hypothetical protein